MKIFSTNPFSWEINKTYEFHWNDEIVESINLSDKAFYKRRNLSINDRLSYFKNLVEILNDQSSELAHLSSIEMWMLYSEALLDIKKAISTIEYYINYSKWMLENKTDNFNWIKSRTIYEPLWIIFVIVPRNYPFNQLIRSIVPNLISWNTVISRHSLTTPQVWEKFNILFKKAWFPKNVFKNLFISNDSLELVISNHKVKWVALTWGEYMWRIVWSLAWKYFKPTILELWWSDPAIVLDKIDNIDYVTDQIIKWRFSNNWQKCNSSKRLIIHKDVYNKIRDKIVEKISKLKHWDQYDKLANIWPLAKKSLYNEMCNYIEDAKNKWANILIWWYWIDWNIFLPTVLENVTKDMDLYYNEVFWPILPIFKCNDIKEILYLANDTYYWLWASIYWNDVEDIEYLIDRLNFSNIAINKPVTSYSHLPYWWINNSWYWKELWEHWLKAFMNEKVIVY